MRGFSPTQPGCLSREGIAGADRGVPLWSGLGSAVRAATGQPAEVFWRSSADALRVPPKAEASLVLRKHLCAAASLKPESKASASKAAGSGLTASSSHAPHYLTRAVSSFPAFALLPFLCTRFARKVGSGHVPITLASPMHVLLAFSEDNTKGLRDHGHSNT